jgi:hypothetical protein
MLAPEETDYFEPAECHASQIVFEPAWVTARICSFEHYRHVCHLPEPRDYGKAANCCHKFATGKTWQKRDNFLPLPHFPRRDK